MTGIELIGAERERQIKVKGWTTTHDDDHTEGELASAAVCYASPLLIYQCEKLVNGVGFVDPWPRYWDDEWDKRGRNQNDELVPNNQASPEKRIRDLVKAGALIAAEIDRLQRVGDKV